MPEAAVCTPAAASGRRMIRLGDVVVRLGRRLFVGHLARGLGRSGDAAQLLYFDAFVAARAPDVIKVSDRSRWRSDSGCMRVATAT